MTEVVSGTLAQYERPDWEPLIALVGVEVVGCFMWMHELELGGGVRVHAYKSIATRRYVHLAADGRVFSYCGRDRYAEITRREALAEAFDGWEELLPPPRDPDAVRALLERHCSASSQETH